MLPASLVLADVTIGDAYSSSTNMGQNVGIDLCISAASNNNFENRNDDISILGFEGRA
jgi:hypothetical protein